MGKRAGLEKFVGGVGVAGVCVFLYLSGLLPHFWVILIGLFMGAFPMIDGLKRMAAEYANRRSIVSQQKLELSASKESAQKAILRIAQKNKGVVTAAMVSLETDLELDKAAAELETMAKKGYIEMRIRDSGIIEYIFAEFA